MKSDDQKPESLSDQKCIKRNAQKRAELMETQERYEDAIVEWGEAFGFASTFSKRRLNKSCDTSSKAKQ